MCCPEEDLGLLKEAQAGVQLLRLPTESAWLSLPQEPIHSGVGSTAVPS